MPMRGDNDSIAALASKLHNATGLQPAAPVRPQPRLEADAEGVQRRAAFEVRLSVGVQIGLARCKRVE